MESNHQQYSRPPSVDSVNLGSIYSGFYPQSSSNPPPVHNIPASYQQQLLPQATQQYHSLTSSYGLGGSIFPQQYIPSYNAAAQVSSLNHQSSQTQSLPPNISYQISASAAAAAAAGFNFKQQQQFHQPAQSPGLAVQNPPIQWPPMGQPPNLGQFGMANTNNLLSPTNLQQPPLANNSDYVNQFYSHYFEEYFQRFYAYQKQQQQIMNQKKIVLYKYNVIHTPTTFSNHNNQLILADPNARINFYGLQEVFTEQCYPHLFLQSLLYVNNDDPTTTLLPFVETNIALDWIRVKQLNNPVMNYELKLILKVITMLLRQNGSVSGIDLSELLFELIMAPGDESERVSLSGSEAKDHYRDLLSHLRQLLMRGQRRVALTFAQNNGMFDHALALSYLFSFLSNENNNFNIHNANVGQLIDNGLIITTIRKFISTLSVDDPLFVFYSHLLQIAINVVNQSSENTTTSLSTAKIDKFESLIILMANDIKFEKVEIADKAYKNLIDLIIALLKDDYNYILPDDLFNDRFDSLLVNECLEFARFHGERLNPKLVLHKLEFAFELFDFGFIQHSINYLTLIKNAIQNPKLDWRLVANNNSKYREFLIPNSASTNDEFDVDLLKNIWSYQILKIFTRVITTEKFELSPLFCKDETTHDEISELVDENNLDEDELDKTDDKIEEIEDEEADLEVSESSISKNEQSSSISPQQQPLPEPQKATISTKLQQTEKSSSITSPINSTIMSNSIQNTPVMEKSSILDESPIVRQDSFESSKSFSSLPPKAQIPHQPRLSLPNIPVSTSTRILNPILENTSSSSDLSLSKSDPLNLMPLPDNDNTFNMNSLQSALPSMIDNKNIYSDSVDNAPPRPPSTTSYPYQPSPMMFQPPPTTMSDSTFDFVSTNGRVSSIPSYDPILKDDQPIEDPNLNYNHKNNEFLQNYNTSSNVNKPASQDNQHLTKSSNGESAQNSPTKVNNGGLLNILFSKLKPKNQMILPDDKDPQIIFDPVTKRWIDKSASDQSGFNSTLPPPPKASFGSNSNSFTSPMSNSVAPSQTSFSNPDQMYSPPPPKTTNDNPPALIPNGDIVPNNNMFGAFIPVAPNANNVSRSDIRRKRYIDVFNTSTKSQ